MVATMVAVFEINFANLLNYVIHERSFKSSTTDSFALMIFKICRDSRVPIRYCDALYTPTGTGYLSHK